MKIYIRLFFVLGSLIVLLICFLNKSAETAGTTASFAEMRSIKTHRAAIDFEREARLNSRQPVARTEPTPAAPLEVKQPDPFQPTTNVTVPDVVFPLPKNAVAHAASDFASGQMENLIITDGLRLKQTDRAGTYYSPGVEAKEPFDAMKVRYDGSRFDEAVLVLEIRARFQNGVWSGWREAPWDASTVIPLETPATAWQYRITMSSQDVSKSPEVDRVVVIVQNKTSQSAE